MSAGEPAPAKTTYHPEHLADRAAMLAMRAMVALQPAADLGPTGRTAFDELMAKTPAADGVTYEAAMVGGVPGWWCGPADAVVGAAILYLHGGAYVVASAQAYRHFAGQIAARAKAPVFVAEYGPAPERPFPAAVEDAEAAYRGLAGVGIPSIAVAGDCAGGGLTLVTTARMAQAARDGATPSPVAASVISPWTDLALTGDSLTTRARQDPLQTPGALQHARDLCIVHANASDPRASPLHGDLADLPPVLLHVGEDEITPDPAALSSRRNARRKLWLPIIEI
jgi:acetyl esterase/lipase